jgi:uncharacterized membrane protein YedE/YeeE
MRLAAAGTAMSLGVHSPIFSRIASHIEPGNVGMAFPWLSARGTPIHSAYFYLPSLLGGALIGLSATLLLATLGRIAGVSGIVSELLLPPSDRESWRIGFVLGLMATGWFLIDRQTTIPVTQSPVAIVIAGLLVGIGTSLGGGCTSGHGVCGLSRFSPRSFAATCVFMCIAMGMVALSRQVLTVGAG